MNSFVIRPGTWAVVRIFSRNPLMRLSDRLEAAIVPVAAFLIIIAAACAGVLGTYVHDAEKQKYLDESTTRHPVTATAIADSTPSVSPSSTDSRVLAKWSANGVGHLESIGWDYPVAAASTLPIWVDANGNQVDAPTPVKRAGANAVTIAFVAWWVTTLAILQITEIARTRIDKSRNTQWERDIRYLADDHNGHTNYS